MMSKQILKEEILQDIDSTKSESIAYSFLETGYAILSRLPEHNYSQQKEFRFQSEKYKTLKEECDAFLEKLRKLYYDKYCVVKGE
jgi:hypothetical protein